MHEATYQVVPPPTLLNRAEPAAVRPHLFTQKSTLKDTTNSNAFFFFFLKPNLFLTRFTQELDVKSI